MAEYDPQASQAAKDLGVDDDKVKKPDAADPLKMRPEVEKALKDHSASLDALSKALGGN